MNSQDSNQMISNENTPNEETLKKKKIPKYLIYIFVFIGILILLFSIILLLKRDKKVDNKRVDSLIKIENSKYLTFKLDDKEYKVGDIVNAYSKDFTYNKSFEEIDYDTSIITSFNKGDKPYFLAFLYCPLKNNCKYETAKVIKISFYDINKVKINDKIDKYSNYEDFKEVYGEESGRYYQDETLYVWSFGEKVGDPYMVVGFDTGGLFSIGGIRKIDLGVWWYEDEYKDTIIKGVDNEKEVNNNN